jgi:ParB/RepB/Spo0J family partition protein
MTVENYPLDLIRDNPWQTRTSYDPAAIEELAADIAAHGLLQIPLGSPGRHKAPDGGAWIDDVALCFGHRRLRAFRLLHERHPQDPNWATMPVDVVLNLTPQDYATYAWAENARRQDVTPIEEARAMQRMMDEFHWSQDLVAKQLGISRPAVANKVRLLKLPADVQTRLAAGELSERQAAALLPLAELPPAVLAEAEKSWNKPSNLIKNASQVSSDQIRRDVASVILNNTTLVTSLSYAEHDFAGLANVRAAVCAQCPARLTVDGKPRCPDKACREHKDRAWEKRQLAAAVTATGIAALDKKAGETVSTNFAFESVTVPEAHAHTCPNLRLTMDAGEKLPDFPGVGIVCIGNKGGACKCLTAAKAKASRKDPAKIQARADQHELDHEVLAPAGAALAAALRAHNVALLGHLFELLDTYGGHKAKAEWTADDALDAIGAVLAKRTLGYQYRPDPAAARRDLGQRLLSLGLAVPWDPDAKPFQPSAEQLAAARERALSEAYRHGQAVINRLLTKHHRDPYQAFLGQTNDDSRTLGVWGGSGETGWQVEARGTGKGGAIKAWLGEGWTMRNADITLTWQDVFVYASQLAEKAEKQ